MLVWVPLHRFMHAALSVADQAPLPPVPCSQHNTWPCLRALSHRPPDAIRAAAHHVTPLRPGPRALTRRPGAEWRWMLLRLHVKARQAYK